MTRARLVLAVALLGLVAGGAAALVAWRDAPAGAAGERAVEVVGPEGVLFSGTVASEGTVLAALLATGLDVEVVEYPGMGAYVAAIAGHRAEGASGWIYEVRRDEAWRPGDRSADAYPLLPGDAVRWRWTVG